VRSFQIQQSRLENPPAAVLEASGNLDDREAPRLDEALERLIAEDSLDVVVDLSALEYIGSPAIGVIAAAYGRLKNTGRKFILCGARGVVRKVLEITNIPSAVPYAETREEALARIQGETPG